jgi:hypothetical protein
MSPRYDETRSTDWEQSSDYAHDLAHYDDYVDRSGFSTVRDATRAGGGIAPIGWVAGLILTIVGVIGSSITWPLLAGGLVLLLGMSLWMVHHVRDRLDSARISHQPPMPDIDPTATDHLHHDVDVRLHPRRDGPAE